MRAGFTRWVPISPPTRRLAEVPAHPHVKAYCVLHALQLCIASMALLSSDKLHAPSTSAPSRPLSSQNVRVPRPLRCPESRAAVACSASSSRQSVAAAPISRPSESYSLGDSQPRHSRMATVARAAVVERSADAPTGQQQTKSLICTSVTASTVDAFIQEIQLASGTGVDIIELRLDFIQARAALSCLAAPRCRQAQCVTSPLQRLTLRRVVRAAPCRISTQSSTSQKSWQPVLFPTS